MVLTAQQLRAVRHRMLLCIGEKIILQGSSIESLLLFGPFVEGLGFLRVH